MYLNIFVVYVVAYSQYGVHDAHTVYTEHGWFAYTGCTPYVQCRHRRLLNYVNFDLCLGVGPSCLFASLKGRRCFVSLLPVVGTFYCARGRRLSNMLMHN